MQNATFGAAVAVAMAAAIVAMPQCSRTGEQLGEADAAANSLGGAGAGAAGGNAGGAAGKGGGTGGGGQAGAAGLGGVGGVIVDAGDAAAGGSDGAAGSIGCPKCVVLAQQPALGIALDDDTVYFGAGKPYGVMKVSKSGGTSVTIASPPADAVAVDETAVYFTSGSLDKGAIFRVDKTGGNLLALAPDQPVTGSIAITGTHVYWTALKSSVDGSIRRVPKAGGTVEVLTTGYPQPMSIAVDTEFAFWCNADGTVRKISLAGGPAAVVATLQYPAGLVLAPMTAFVDATGLKAVPKTGGPVESVATSGHVPAVDGTHVYWWAEVWVKPGPIAFASLWRRALGGGPIQVLADGLAPPKAMAIDATAVYWTTTGSYCPQQPGPACDAAAPGAVMKMAK